VVKVNWGTCRRCGREIFNVPEEAFDVLLVASPEVRGPSGLVYCEWCGRVHSAIVMLDPEAKPREAAR
jgi:hypothetical protein